VVVQALAIAVRQPRHAPIGHAGCRAERRQARRYMGEGGSASCYQIAFT
jgi:hypothetical protein